MSGEIPSLGLYKGKSWTEWTKVLAHTNYMAEVIETEANPPVRLLPRRDIYVYGTCPKMDVRVLCHCEKCGKVLMPQAFFENHQKVKHGLEQQLTSITSQSASKKKNSHSKNKKKTTHLPPPPSLFPKTPTPPPAIVIQPTVELPPPVLQPIQAPLPVSSPPNSRHKKSKKSSKKGKEFDPEKHCGIYDGNKGPCLRAIGCTNHVVKKTVMGKSKEVVVSQADQKAAKEQDSMKNSVVNVPKIMENTATSTSQTSSRNLPTTFVKIAPVPSPVMTTAKNDMPIISQALQVSISPCTTTSVNSQGNVSPSSVVYMPMSPVAVVGPVQFVQLGGPLLRVASTQPLLSPPLATQPIVVTIPVPNSSSVYTPHPKPISMSTSSARRIGGSLLLQNQRIDRQRNEIHMAANTRRINNTCSVINTHPHRPNILKNSAKNNMRYNNLKRPAASDKVANESKQIRISTDSLNGFIYTEVTDTTETPPNNNSVHEKITLLNMK